MARHIEPIWTAGRRTLRSEQGSTLLWLLALAALGIAVASGSMRLLMQKERLNELDYASLRAFQNAENGLEWARACWLQARSTDSMDPDPQLPLRYSLACPDLRDAADILIERDARDWRIRVQGSFLSARRTLEARLPDPQQGEAVIVAIAGKLVGDGRLDLGALHQQDLLLSASSQGLSLALPPGFAAGEEEALRVRTIKLAGEAIPQGDLLFREDEDGMLMLSALPFVDRAIWPDTAAERTLACRGTLYIGDNPEQPIVLDSGRIVLMAERIEINGMLRFDEGSDAELWLLAEKGIVWRSAAVQQRFRGILSSPGSIRLLGPAASSWQFAAALYAGELELWGAQLTMQPNSSLYVPERCLPLRLHYPVLQGWRSIIEEEWAKK